MRPHLSFTGLLALLAQLSHGQAPTLPVDSATAHQYTYVEKMPVFPGGKPGETGATANQRFLNFLQDSLRVLPALARDGMAGRVSFSFTVTALGRTENIRLVQRLRADADAEVLRTAHRLDPIQWQPGTQNGRPVSVVFTVPISFNTNSKRTTEFVGDSLDTGPYQRQMAFPISNWDSKRWLAPKGKGLIYGSCLQRLGGSSSLGMAEYVRLVNLTTHKSVSFSVKPAMKSRRENSFFYALPAGRYALHLYMYPDKIWGPYRMHFEGLRKPVAPASGEPVRHTRYQFTVVSGKVHYVGTWNLANENQPEFLNEKDLIDPAIQAYFPQFNFQEAVVSLPQ